MSRTRRRTQPGVSPSFRPAARVLLIAMASAWSVATPAAWAQATAPAGATAAAAKTYDIASGPLVQVISRFAAQAGIALTFDANALQGLNSPGVRGTYTVDGGLQQVLASSGWSATRAANGAYVLGRAAPAVALGAAGTTATLAEVSVVAPSMSSATTESTQSYSATATTLFKSTQSIRGTPQPVTVVTRQQLDDRATLDLTDVLRNTPGITVDYTDSERVGYYSRGYAIDSLQFDGMTVSQGGSEFVQPDMATLDRVEILRGASGMIRGTGNPSATVNLVRKRPTREFQASAGLTLGSWNRRRIEGDISGPLNEAGTLRGRLVAVSDTKDFFQDVRDEDRKVFYGVLQADLTPNTTVTATLQRTDLEASGAWGGLPGTFNGLQLGLPRSTYLGTSWNRWNRHNNQASFEVEHRFDNEWNLKLNAAYTGFRGDAFKQSSASRASTTNPYLVLLSGAQYDGGASDQNSLNATAHGPISLFGRKHELSFGAEVVNVNTTNSSGYFNLSPRTIDLRTFNSNTTMPEPFVSATNGTFFRGAVNKTEQRAVFATGRFSLADPLTAIIGARATWYDYQAPATPASNYGVDREITPYAGMVLDLNENFSAYASYSEIFTPQSGYTRSGGSLPPITGEDYETGIKGEFFGGLLNTSLSLFRINNVGRAVNDLSSPNPCVPYYATGYCRIDGGKTESKGWELEASGEITPSWHVMAGYTNTRTKYLADSTASNVGQPLRTADPRHLLRVFTTYKLPGALSAFTIGGGVQAQSDTYVSSGSIRATQGGYTVYNAMLGYQINRDMRLQLNVNNLFDKVYYNKLGVGNGFNTYYGEPRNVMLNLTAKF